MKKKTRININTTLKIYVKVFLSLIFNKGNENEIVFKNALKKYFLTENILLTSQGRVAAYNIFKVILSKKKKEILISPYTLTEVINAIIYAGGIPIYVEIDLKNGLPMENDLDKKININTAGLVLTHLYSNKDDILKFQRKYEGKITIIEDVAINFGAKIEDSRPLGTIFDFGFYSFGVMKNLCTFHGGAIICKKKTKLDEINNNIKNNLNYPLSSTLKLLFFSLFIELLFCKYIYNFFTHFILKLSIKKVDQMIYPGVYPKLNKLKPLNYNYKFQSNFAIAGIENLKTLKSKHHSKIKRVKLYEKYLNRNLKINKFTYYEANSFLEYPILLKKNKNKFLSKKLLNIGYDIRHTWYVNSLRYLPLNSSLGSFVNCELLHEKILSLPTHDLISENDIIRICNLINFYEKT